ncbi:hypothetical protein [Rhodopirellula europaea]|uniref:hypothetical protein n=1 Tax=Rhodopirellula europaea TaxID=1263866 RepID=UPI00068C2EC7|nr:hypothetical protein [Rhodopirellula europaea]
MPAKAAKVIVTEKLQVILQQFAKARSSSVRWLSGVELSCWLSMVMTTRRSSKRLDCSMMPLASGEEGGEINGLD